MEKLNATLFIKDARQKLAGKDTLRMAAIHAGVTVAAGLVITLLQYILAEGIGNTSGLSGMGTRSLLQTLQTVLQWANAILMPFWNLGFLYVAMQWARGNTPQTGDLLTGFHRIGPCLGLLLNRFFLAFGVVFVCANISTMLYMLMPASGKLMEMAAAAGGDMDVFYSTMEQADFTALMGAMTPLLILWGVLCLVILVPILYRFRLAEYAVLNLKGVRALPAMMISAALLRRRCWQFFKIDLRLWWYYGLKFLCVLICYADLLLSSLGIALPVGGDAAYFVSYVLYLAALFCVETCFRPRVETAYACAYETLMAMGPAQKKTVPAEPQNMPWDEQ